MNLFCQNPNDIVLASYANAVDSSLIIDALVTATLVERTPGGIITGATNATPIVITSAAHGLLDGDLVYISQVDGNYAANGLFTVRNPTTNTFQLESTSGGGNYIEGGVWYRPVLGAAGLTLAWNSTRKEYRATISETVPLVAGNSYFAMLDTSYGDHWEVAAQATIRQ